MARSAPLYLDSRRSPDWRAADLLGRMTLDEKIAQLGAVWGSDLLDGKSLSHDKATLLLADGIGQITRLAGNTLLGPRDAAAAANQIQRFLVEGTRLGIPALFHEESCAGLATKSATQFPQAIGLASTFEPELVERMAEVIREQMLAIGARQALAPVLDVARDPRWGRVEETFGEDPYLAARMGVAYVRGVQGADLREGVVATAKHFMGYGASEGGRNWGPCQLPTRELLERILPPFAAAIQEAGVRSVMNGYHEIDGVPCGASAWLLDELLRGELGFRGTVVADYFTVLCLMTFHRVAGDAKEAAARALEAGLDVELPSRECYGAPLKEAALSGRIKTGHVDRAVLRVLAQKFELGLFERPFVPESNAPSVFDTEDQRALAREIARKSIVLLKNEDELLPLPSDLRRIAVVGPNADNVRHLQGDYHFPTHYEITFGATPEPRASGGDRAASGVDLLAQFTPHVSVLAGIRAAVSERTEVVHAAGGSVHGATDDELREAVELARSADVAVVVVGGRSGLVSGCTSGESMDATRLELTGDQVQLVREVAATGTKTVVVLVNGRVLALEHVESLAPALLEAWLPGEEGGHAVADVLFGRENPAGRLPVTLPRSAGQVPLYYNHKPSGARCMFRGDYSDGPVTPLFPFGHGLSYTRFEYRDLAFSAVEVGTADVIGVACTVVNTGTRLGEEVVQLYVSDLVASVTRPERELRGFARIGLAPGEAKRVEFELPVAQLAFYDVAMQLAVEPGEIGIFVGSSSADVRLEGTVTIRGERRAVQRAEIRPTRVTVRDAFG
jgi:beta-glucosidase